MKKQPIILIPCPLHEDAFLIKGFEDTMLELDIRASRSIIPGYYLELKPYMDMRGIMHEEFFAEMIEDMVRAFKMMNELNEMGHDHYEDTEIQRCCFTFLPNSILIQND